RHERRLLQRPEPHRSVLVSALREDGRARRAGDAARERGVQHAVFPNDGVVLPRGRYGRVHAAHDFRSLQGFPRAQAHHPARRRRRAVSLGPIPRTRGHAEASAAQGIGAEQRLLRHLRLSPARHRLAARRHSGRQHFVRVGDGRRGARRRPGDGALLRRHEALHRRQQEAHGRGAREDFRGQRAQSLQALPEDALTGDRLAMSDNRPSPPARDVRRRGRRGAAVVVALAWFACGFALAQPASDPARIVAMSDVHGAYDAFVGLLRAAKVVDDTTAGSGDRATLGVVGDTLDRANGSRRVLELLMRLETEARAAGGRAQLVLGNHEVMNLTGALDYVTAEDYAAYAADETSAEREAALGRFRSARAATGGDAAAVAAE